MIKKKTIKVKKLAKYLKKYPNVRLVLEIQKGTKHHSAGTFTIKSSGGDYTNISNWDAGEACDLIGLGQSIAECYDEWASGKQQIGQ